MTSAVDLDQYWGVRLSRIRHDCGAMAITFELDWTLDAAQFRASLRFSGVSRFELIGEKIISSEVVELISLESKRVGKGWCVVGELSNYQFTIECAEIIEES